MSNIKNIKEQLINGEKDEALLTVYTKESL